MTKITHLMALERADKIINWMASYIGRMAPPENGIYDLNQHWLYMERLGKKPRRGWKSRGGDDRPLDQKPAVYQGVGPDNMEDAEEGDF